MYEYELDYNVDLNYETKLIEYFNSIEDTELDFVSIEVTKLA